jgi:hypothetical protein
MQELGKARRGSVKAEDLGPGTSCRLRGSEAGKQR